MTTARDWKLVFTCPVCRQASEVGVANLATVMRCPHCRTSVVIEKDGIQKASKRPRRTPSPSQVKPRRKKSRRGNLVSDKLAYGLAWGGVISILVTAGLVAAGTLATFSSNGLYAPDDKYALRSAAESFQSAWLDEDFAVAKSFVLNSDQPYFQKWSDPRRAALEAGFGPGVRGHVTEVEIVEMEMDRAVVRVAFEMRIRKQQVFQNWQLVGGYWRLNLEQASSD